MNALELYRKHKKLKKYEMAELLGITSGFYSQISNGDRGITVENSKKWSIALNNELTPAQILGLEPIELTPLPPETQQGDDPKQSAVQ